MYASIAAMTTSRMVVSCVYAANLNRRRSAFGTPLIIMISVLLGGFGRGAVGISVGASRPGFILNLLKLVYY